MVKMGISYHRNRDGIFVDVSCVCRVFDFSISHTNTNKII